MTMIRFFNIRQRAVLFLAGAVLVSLLAASEASAVGLTFARTLRIGSRGDDVRELQIFLNKNGATALMVSPGSGGSIGNETEYFGAKTAEAVSRFQELYRSEVLTPIGLVRGTGFVGSLTLAKLNSIAAPPIVVVPTLSASIPTPTVVPPRVITPIVVPGPGSPDVVQEPVITSISPTAGPAGTTVVIRGAGFTSTGNTVYTGYAELTNVSSGDGKTMSIVIDPGWPKFRQGSVVFPFWIYVINGAGKSNPAIFNYQ